VTWDEKERGTGTYWGATLPDSFIEYATPDVTTDAPAPVPEVLKQAIASLS
jgi:catechol 2,3-dioxygenase